MADKLAIKRKSSSALTIRSLQSSRQMATEMITLACAKFGKELTGPEAKSWREILEREPSGAIEFAFKEYWRTPPEDGSREWFPEEWQIMQLLARWHGEQERVRKEAELEADRRETEARRQRGETIVWATVKTMFKEKVEKLESRKFPQISPDRKQSLRKQIETLREKSSAEKQA